MSSAKEQAEELDRLVADVTDIEKQKEATTSAQEKVVALKAQSAAERRAEALLKAKKITLTDEKTKLEEENAELKKQQENGPLKRFKDFINARGALIADLQLRNEWFQFGASIPTESLRTAQIDTLCEYASGWSTFSEDVKKKLEELQPESDFLANEGADTTLDSSIEEKHDETQKLFEEHSARWLREAKRRETYDEQINNFKTDQAKLIQWCRQQTSNLNDLTEPDQVQEFCTSFHNNLNAMESNFLVLVEMAEKLLPNSTVRSALVEVAEGWIRLEVFAFEKLRGTLLELHTKSGLESECRGWVEYAQRFKEFLLDAEKLLNEPTDEQSVEVMKPVKQACKQLLQDYDAHLLIVEHLSDFTLREECVKDHYNAVRKTIFSKLTLLTQSFQGQYNFARKQEYSDRMAELNDWIEVKSQTTAWKELLKRVDRMKKLIEDSELTAEDEQN